MTRWHQISDRVFFPHMKSNRKHCRHFQFFNIVPCANKETERWQEKKMVQLRQAFREMHPPAFTGGPLSKTQIPQQLLVGRHPILLLGGVSCHGREMHKKEGGRRRPTHPSPRCLSYHRESAHVEAGTRQNNTVSSGPAPLCQGQASKHSTILFFTAIKASALNKTQDMSHPCRHSMSRALVHQKDIKSDYLVRDDEKAKETLK